MERHGRVKYYNGYLLKNRIKLEKNEDENF